MFDNDQSQIELLSSNDVNFNNLTQAGEFIEELLDDTILQRIANDYAFSFWIGVLALLTVIALHRVLRCLRLESWIRQTAPSSTSTSASRLSPSTLFYRVTSIIRGVSYFQPGPSGYARIVKLPALGSVALLSAYLLFILLLEFVDDNVEGAQYWQAMGIRAAWLAVAQVPLIILTVGKLNWISLVTGVSYERLNIFHRWASRIMLLLAIFHLAFQVHGWSQYPGILHLEWTTDECVPTGLAAFVLLVWMNISTLAPIRNLWYKFFVIQHILTWFGLVIAIMLHLPTTALSSRIWMYIPIGLYILDRGARGLWYLYVNFNTSKSTIIGMPGDATLIRVRCSKIKSWQAGAHMLISLPRIGLAQSHPATILSTPQSHDGDLVFLLKRHKGFTKSLYEHAGALRNVDDTQHGGRQCRMLVEGPFGGLPTDFGAFDSVCLIAGSTGITFVLATLLDLVQRARTASKKLPLRHIHLFWAVKTNAQLEWVSPELDQALREAAKVGIHVNAQLFVTSDAAPTGASSNTHLVKKDGEKIFPGPSVGSGPTASAPFTNNFIPTLQQSRPNLPQIVTEVVVSDSRRYGVVVCGPLGMSTDVRNTVARLCLSGKHQMYLHVEGFSL